MAARSCRLGLLIFGRTLRFGLGGREVNAVPNGAPIYSLDCLASWRRVDQKQVPRGDVFRQPEHSERPVFHPLSPDRVRGGGVVPGLLDIVIATHVALVRSGLDRLFLEGSQAQINDHLSRTAGSLKNQSAQNCTRIGSVFTKIQTVRARNAQYGWF